jgi:hypothetical protein
VVIETEKKNPTRASTEPEGEKKKRRFKPSPRKKGNGDTPLGYSGQTAVRREQCDEIPESQNR